MVPGHVGFYSNRLMGLMAILDEETVLDPLGIVGTHSDKQLFQKVEVNCGVNSAFDDGEEEPAIRYNCRYQHQVLEPNH
jgi:hypothetical protein